MRTKLLRFRCTGCDLQMMLPEKPEKCFCCGSTAIVREGWRQRFSRLRDGSRNSSDSQNSKGKE